MGGGVRFCVPVFMFVSVYLSGKLIHHGEMRDLKRRIKRLYMPFAAWGILGFVLESSFEHTFDILDLLSQLTIGVPSYPPLYFMFLLAVNTLILFSISRCGRFSMVLFAACFVGCLILQYTGLNLKMFSSLPFHSQHALGRFAELLPAAICGYGLFRLSWKWPLAICFTMGFILASVLGSSLHCDGFSYQGVYLMCGAAAVSSVLVLLGKGISSKMPDIVSVFIGGIAGLTAGIYYVHILVGKSLEIVFGRHRSILEAMMVLLLSALVVFAIKKMRKLAWVVA